MYMYIYIYIYSRALPVGHVQVVPLGDAAPDGRSAARRLGPVGAGAVAEVGVPAVHEAPGGHVGATLGPRWGHVGPPVFGGRGVLGPWRAWFFVS